MTDYLDGSWWLGLWIGALAAWGFVLALLARRDYRDTEEDVERVLEARRLPPADPLNGEAGKPGAESFKDD